MITPPPLIDARPGDPITAESWNNILQAVRTIYDALNKTLGTLSVLVKDRDTGNPIPGAVVTLIPTADTGRLVRTAVYVGATVKLYLAHQLLPGAYDVTVEAQGYRPETRSITIDQVGGSQALVVEMITTEVRVAMPDLFGMALTRAIDAVGTAGLKVGRIIDSHGKEIPPAAIPQEIQAASVLNQVPEAEMLIPKDTAVQIHVSAKAEFLERVKVPDLHGLTLEEAKAKLEAVGLVLGETPQAR